MSSSPGSSPAFLGPGEGGRDDDAADGDGVERAAARREQLAAAPNFARAPPVAFKHFFPERAFSVMDPLNNTIRQLYGFFVKNPPEEKHHDVIVNYEALVEHGECASCLRLLEDDPEDFLGALAVAACEYLHRQDSLSRSDGTMHALSTATAAPGLTLTGTGGTASFAGPGYDWRKLTMRLSNHGPVSTMRTLKANAIGKLVTVRGTVVRASSITPLVRNMRFTCNGCGESNLVEFDDGRYSLPANCCTANCKSTSFEPDRPSARTVDLQKIRLQEILDDVNYEAGRIPRTIEVELLDSLVDSCVPGVVVTITGLVKVVTSELKRTKDKTKTLFVLYIHANMVNNSKSSQSGQLDLVQYSLKDMYLVSDIAGHANIFHLLVNSLAPAIYGHELVKAGWILALVGGNQDLATDERQGVALRGDIHVLVVGDPGIGKSQMLRSVAAVAPRGVYVCGNTTSSSGLTVTLVKDSATGDYALEAGALVLGDQGVCCIDEFDKMKSEHNSLLEAMEQQSVSIAKAGIIANLPARTSVLAAANPIGGHYSFSKTVSENLKMAPALLSRFDLIFVLVDRPDQDMDARLSEHVMKMHGGGARQDQPAPRRPSASEVFRASGIAGLDDGGEDRGRQLRALLKKERVDDFEPLPHPLLRKYISYARKYVHPKLSSEAADLLQAFYITLRQTHRGAETTPITTRQLESLIRLAEARAKLELRELVTADDAQDAIALVKESMVDVLVDEAGRMDFERTSGVSKRSIVKTYVAELHRLAEQTYNSLFTMKQLYKVATDIQISASDFRDMIAKLNHQGYLVKKRNDTYQLVSASAAEGGH